MLDFGWLEIKKLILKKIQLFEEGGGSRVQLENSS